VDFLVLRIHRHLHEWLHVLPTIECAQSSEGRINDHEVRAVAFAEYGAFNRCGNATSCAPALAASSISTAALSIEASRFMNTGAACTAAALMVFIRARFLAVARPLQADRFSCASVDSRGSPGR